MSRRLRLTAAPYALYALVFIAAPLLLILYYSLTTGQGATLSLDNFRRFFDFNDTVYLRVLWRSLWIAGVSTAICFVLGYPMAYILSRMKARTRNIVSFLFILPMWMNFLLRTYAWMTLLERTGVINTALKSVGLPSLEIMYTTGAVILGNVYNFLPFMILPIYTSLTKIDRNLIEASEDLGAGRAVTFFRVIFPLSFPGIMSGLTMTFMPAVTTFIISKLLGGGQNALIGDLIEKQFKVAGDWGFGSAMSVILMVLILLSMNALSRYEKENAGGGLM
ncbi:MAG: ABC transporter permease [Oscillospiraceae bacterium]|nr:ABC transporter permease [Oscillospiraceae bacterium]